MADSILPMFKTFLGIDLADTTHDLALGLDLKVALTIIETYLDRIIAKRPVSEEYDHHFGTISLQNTPLDGAVQVTIDGVPQTDYSTYGQHGMVYLTRAGSFDANYVHDWASFKQVEITYFAGYDPIPDDLAYAIVLTAAGIHAASGGGGAVAGMEISSMSVPDVGTIRYSSTGGASGGDAGGGAFGPIPQGALSILGLYRRLRA